MKYVGIAAIIVLILGLGTINIKHNLSLPQELTSKDYISHTYFWNTAFPYLHTAYDIQLSDEITGPNTVRAVERVLQHTEKGDTVLVHLHGYGGQVEPTLGIINNIRTSNAVVTMSVEAPVYSGHAYLAVNGDQMVIGDTAYLMFHHSSAYNLDCKKAGTEITDRNMTDEEHCDLMKKNHMILVEQMIAQSQVLTTEEKMLLQDGKDVYIQSDEVRRRLK